MAIKHIFISYKHGIPSTQIAKALYDHLEAVSDALDFEIFMDDEANRAGDDWQKNIDQALAKTTHFISLLSTAYWLSSACRQEVCQVLARFEKEGSPRLLFVMAETIRPDLFTFDKDRKTGRLQSDNPQVNRVGDIHFLGPFDSSTRLVRLEPERPALFNDQLAQLLRRLERAL